MAWIKDPLTAFESHFTKEPGGACWLWQGVRFIRGGYGTFTHRPSGQVVRRAHRVSWELYRGDIPEGMHVLHKCDCRLCVNPDHLFLGDQSENMADKVSKLRQNRGDKHGMSKLIEAQAIKVKADPRPYAEIAIDFGISIQTVSNIKLGRSWKHLP
jgi:hypothetical protein